MPISAAFSTCSGVPPSTAANPPAAMEQATPTSPWQPTSAPEIEASRLALVGDGSHRVSLDQVIETMRKTGLDMNERYKETSLGGLAVNVVEC